MNPMILIVEDDWGAAQVFEQILRLNGYRVSVASDAEHGFSAVQEVNPSAILLDLHLPAANGVELLRQIRADAAHAQTPAALVTGDYFVEEDIVEELQTLGARLYFKPLWEEDLVTLVHDLLRG